MNRKWVIEVVADMRDKGKIDTITKLVCRQAAHLQAAVYLIADEQKPQVAAYSDDFFAGRSELALMIENDSYPEAAVTAEPPADSDDEISDELMDAFTKK